MMTASFDERQAKSFAEEVGNFDCLLSEAMTRTLPHLSHKFGLAWDSMRVAIDIRGNHKRGGKDLG